MMGLFDLVPDLEAMNERLVAKLDEVLKRLDTLIELERDCRYGDGR